MTMQYCPSFRVLPGTRNVETTLETAYKNVKEVVRYWRVCGHAASLRIRRFSGLRVLSAAQCVVQERFVSFQFFGPLLSLVETLLGFNPVLDKPQKSRDAQSLLLTLRPLPSAIAQDKCESLLA
jgi:hypothetical protein